MLKDACEKILRGRRGRPVNGDVARRWVRSGCRVGGHVLFLPAVMLAGAYHVMPEWARAFEAKRRSLGRVGVK